MSSPIRLSRRRVRCQGSSASASSRSAIAGFTPWKAVCWPSTSEQPRVGVLGAERLHVAGAGSPGRGDLGGHTYGVRRDAERLREPQLAGQPAITPRRSREDRRGRRRAARGRRPGRRATEHPAAAVMPTPTNRKDPARLAVSRAAGTSLKGSVAR